MPLLNRHRTAAAGAVVALLTVGAGLAAIGSGTIAFGPGAGGDAVIVVGVDSHTVVFQPTQGDLVKAARDITYDQGICESDSWLRVNPTCAQQLQSCAKQLDRSTIPVLATFDDRGYRYACTTQS